MLKKKKRMRRQQRRDPRRMNLQNKNRKSQHSISRPLRIIIFFFFFFFFHNDTQRTQTFCKMLINRSELYTLIIAQLLEDGFVDAAVSLGTAVQIATAVPAGERSMPERVARQRLASLVDIGLQHEQQLSGAERVSIYGSVDGEPVANANIGSLPNAQEDRFRAVLPGLNLDEEDNGAFETNYASVFMANHKNGVLSAAFSNDGLYLCTGSSDSSIKLLDVGKMKAVGINDAAAAQARPTLRTFYDHHEAVNDVVFHPYSTIVASASDDCTVRLFDIVGANRKAFRVLSDVARVLSVSFHPSGDYLLASTTGRVVRLYDVASGACFKSRDEASQHAGGVPHASWSPDGTLFATAGEDGDVKLWDGVSQKLTYAFARFNNGAAMLSARFSRNSHYLLVTGADGVASLVDVRTHAILRRFGDPSSAVRASASSNRGAAFSCDERLVLLPNAHSSALTIYSTRDGRLLEQLRGHNAPVNAVTASPTEPLIVTAGLDSKARLWVAASASTSKQ